MEHIPEVSKWCVQHANRAINVQWVKSGNPVLQAHIQRVVQLFVLLVLQVTYVEKELYLPPIPQLKTLRYVPKVRIVMEKQSTIVRQVLSTMLLESHDSLIVSAVFPVIFVQDPAQVCKIIYPTFAPKGTTVLQLREPAKNSLVLGVLTTQLNNQLPSVLVNHVLMVHIVLEDQLVQ